MKLSIRIILYFSIFALTACSGSDSNSNKENTFNINGLLVFDLIESSDSGGSYKIIFNKGFIKKKEIIFTKDKGNSAFIHKDGKSLIYLEPCGDISEYFNNENRISLFKNTLSPRRVSPCSENIVIKHQGSPYDRVLSRFDVAMLSPDKTRVVGSGYYYDSQDNGGYDDGYYYIVIVYDALTGKEIKRYQHYTTPSWHPDGRLLLQASGYGRLDSDFGLYITDKKLTSLSRVDNQEINFKVDYVSISPSGKLITFVKGNELWMLGVNGKNLHKVLTEDIKVMNIVSPTWSPTEKYIAYLTLKEKYRAEKKITFYQPSSNKIFKLDLKDILPPCSTCNTSRADMSPSPPLSWAN